MKILGAKVDPMEKYANDPYLLVLLDEKGLKDHDPSKQVHEVFQREDGHTLYRAVWEDGYVHFLAHNPKNQNGYGGSTFAVMTKQGLVALKGPWSSRPGVMNAAFGDPYCFSATFCYQSEYLRVSGALTVEKVVEILDEFCPDWELVTDVKSYAPDEPSHILRRK